LTIIVRNPTLYAVISIELGIFINVGFTKVTGKAKARGKWWKDARVMAPILLPILLTLVLAITELGPFLGKYPTFGTDWTDFFLAIGFGFGLGATFENVGSKLAASRH
jgi:hypothetical protein